MEFENALNINEVLTQLLNITANMYDSQGYMIISEVGPVILQAENRIKELNGEAFLQ